MDEKRSASETGSDVDGMNGTLMSGDASESSERSRTAGKTAGVEGIDVEVVVVDDGDTSVGEVRATQCGLGRWRPRRLRPFGTMWSFTGAVSMLWVIAGISFTYYSAVIPQIERRFGLASWLSGFLRNVDNVGYVVVILAVSHLGRYANKPRILAASSLLSAASILVFAVPHFIYGGPGQQYVIRLSCLGSERPHGLHVLSHAPKILLLY